MSTSDASIERRSCGLLVSAFLLILLIVIAAIGALSYWVYLRLGLIWAVITSCSIVFVVSLLIYRSRKQSVLNANVKIYVEVNPETRARLKKFVNLLRNLQRGDKVDEETKNIRIKLNTLIDIETQLRLKCVQFDEYYLHPEMLIELQNYIHIAERYGDIVCVEELQRLQSLLERCKQQGVINAFMELGYCATKNLLEVAATGIQSTICIEYSRKVKRDPKSSDKISTPKIQHFQCERCKHYFVDYVWLLIDIYERPDLFSQLPQIHTFECPHCGHQIRLEDHAVLIHFYSDTIPPMIIYTSTRMKWNPVNHEEIILAMDQKLPNISKTFASDSVKDDIFRIEYGPVHPDIGAMDLIREAKEQMIEFGIKNQKEFTNWLASVLMNLRNFEMVMLFYAGAMHDLYPLYKYEEGNKHVGSDIFNEALDKVFEDRRSITLRITKIAIPIIGVLMGLFFYRQISLESNFWNLAKRGLYIGAIFGFVVILILLWITPMVMLIESKIRKINLPILTPGLELFGYTLILVLLAAIVGLIFNLLVMSIYPILAKWISVKLFTRISGALLGLLGGLILNNRRSALEVILFARHGETIFSPRQILHDRLRH